jgi:hypothetical protein
MRWKVYRLWAGDAGTTRYGFLRRLVLTDANDHGPTEVGRRDLGPKLD